MIWAGEAGARLSSLQAGGVLRGCSRFAQEVLRVCSGDAQALLQESRASSMSNRPAVTL